MLIDVITAYTWRWIGEDEWTPLINKDELEREWLVVGE